jgi:hypothetical protein
MQWSNEMNGNTRARTYRETISHYQELREAVYEFSESEFREFSAKFSEISYKDAVEADAWRWNDINKIPIWEWTRMYHDYHTHSGVKRFDVAIRAQGKLCALCYGVPSRRKLILKLHALSRLPNDNPLGGKILSMVLFAADAYARLIDAQEMWLCNPMNDNLVKLYEGAGFTAHYNNIGLATHLSIRINP